MQRLSTEAESADIYNDLFLLIYLLHQQTLGDFNVLKEDRLEKGDKRDLIKIYIAQAIELVKTLKLAIGLENNAKEHTYQTLQKYLLDQYLQKNHFSSDEKEMAIIFAGKMLAACFDQYSDQLTSDFALFGELVSDNGICLFYKKVEWGMDFKFDLNWSVKFPIPENSIKAIVSRWEENQRAGAALDPLPVTEEVYQPPHSSKPDYDMYYEWKKREDDQKLAKFQHHFKHDLLQTTYVAAFDELKRYEDMPRTSWIGRFLGVPPANIEIAYTFLLDLNKIREDKLSSNMEKIIQINDLFYDVTAKLKQASSERLLPIVSALHRNFLQALEQAGFNLNEEIVPATR